MSKGQSLQDPFLNALRRERVPVSVYLVNGIKLQGTIESFDQFVVLLRNTVSQMVYKHAISTVVPARNVRVGPGGGAVASGGASSGPLRPQAAASAQTATRTAILIGFMRGAPSTRRWLRAPGRARCRHRTGGWRPTARRSARRTPRR